VESTTSGIKETTTTTATPTQQSSIETSATQLKGKASLSTNAALANKIKFLYGYMVKDTKINKAIFIQYQTILFNVCSKY
jgi:hypothetical protein